MLHHILIRGPGLGLVPLQIDGTYWRFPSQPNLGLASTAFPMPVTTCCVCSGRGTGRGPCPQSRGHLQACLPAHSVLARYPSGPGPVFGLFHLPPHSVNPPLTRDPFPFSIFPFPFYLIKGKTGGVGRKAHYKVSAQLGFWRDLIT